MAYILNRLNQRTLYAGITEKVRNNKNVTKKWYFEIEGSRIKGPRKIFQTQIEAESACMMNIDVKS